ncbi:MAG: S8 family serine peptidase, partial [Thermoplasmata archaeon]
MKKNNMTCIWSGVLVAILLISVFSAGFALSRESGEEDIFILVYKRGITTESLMKAEGFDVLADYDEFVLVSTSLDMSNELKAQGYMIDSLENREDVMLQSYSFNVGEGLPEIPAELRIDEYPEGVQRPYIVQFIGPIIDEWKEELIDMGAVPQEYRHRYNFIVEMDSETAEEVERLDFVNWVGIYQPAYKFDNALLESPGILDLEVYTSQTADDTISTAQHISYLGAEVNLIRDGHMFVEADASNIKAIANMPHVISIARRVTDLELFNYHATWVAQTNEFENRKVTDMGVTGLGELITVCDSELYHEHEAFADPDGNPIGDTHRKVQAYYVPGDAGGDLEEGVYHGTHVSGSVLGDAPPYGDYNNHDGNAMEARLVFQDVSPGAAVSPPSDMYNDGWGEPYGWGSRIHTNSWGGGNGYSGLAVDADEFTWDHRDFNILFAAGNSGNRGAGSISNQAEGKNIFTVGSIQNYDSQNDLSGFSSRGYATDGRIKPTMLHVGGSLNSAGDENSVDYQSMSGTSMATPSLAGQVGQVRHYYVGGWYPSGVETPGDGFNPSGALIKATMINGAVEITGNSAYENDQRFPNNDQGFGRSMLDRSLYFDGDDRKAYVFDSWNEDVELSTGQSWDMDFEVNDPSQELEVTLVWSDYPG